MELDLNIDFEFENIDIENQDDGVLCATFIKSKKNKNSNRAVLYLHGYIDYFFHPHVAEKFYDFGFDFYALDLRRYGRSLRKGNRSNYCSSISEYYEEIDIAIEKIKENSQNVYLLGHSTGGLIATCYMSQGKNKSFITGLVLNSPFFDMNQSRLLTSCMYRVVKLLTYVSPKGYSNKGLSPIYAESLHENFKGEWSFNLAWKPIKGFPVYFKWFVAIIEAQRSLADSSIEIPILLMHSEKSLKPKKHIKEVSVKDTVLNVEDMKRIGPLLGPNIKFASIENGLHDLFLSSIEVRDRAFNEMFTWFELYK